MTTKHMLSVNLPSTLGTYLKLAQTTFGDESKATKYLREKIAATPNGAEEEVIAEESQMLHMLASLDKAPD